MAEKPKAPRKRPAPTIDLTATEVKPAEQPAFKSSAEKPDSDFIDRAWAWSRANVSLRSIAAGLIGGVLVALVLAGLWVFGQVPNRYSLASGVASKDVDVLSQRLVKIEDQLSKLPANDADRLSAADNAMKSLGIALTALNKRVEDAAEAQKDLSRRVETQEALEKRIAELEAAAKTEKEQIAKNTGADNAARLALSAAALREAVQRGMPFAAELTAAKSLAGDSANALAPLDSFAATGLPTDAALVAQLHALLPQILKLSGAPPDAGFFERLQANAGNLVRVRPVDAPAGDDPSAVLARLETGIARADVPALLADAARLPANVRAPADDWIERAAARQQAVEAARQFAADAARDLRGP